MGLTGFLGLGFAFRRQASSSIVPDDVPGRERIEPGFHGTRPGATSEDPEAPHRTSPPPLPSERDTTAAAQPAIAAKPPPLPASAIAVPTDDTPTDASAMRRLGARLIDNFIAACVAGLIALVVFTANQSSPFGQHGDGLSPLISGLMLSASWMLAVMVVDGVIRAVFGNTFGKKLLRMEVVDRHGKWLSRRAYLGRNVHIWFSGFGLGIWLMSVIMPTIQIWRIGSGKPATYDENTGVRVLATGEISAGRKVVAGAPLIIPLVLIALSSWALREQNRADEIRPIGATWQNPLTQESVGVPLGWVDHTSTVPRNPNGLKPVVVFESEDGSSGALLYRVTMHRSTTQARARAYMDANAHRLAFDDGGTFDTLGPAWERWRVHAVTRGDKAPRIVTIFRHDDDYWLLVAFDKAGAKAESPRLKDLCERIARTILGRPQP